MPVILFLSLLFYFSRPYAETFEVPPIASIGEALSQTSQNDTVLVHPGFYPERLILPFHDLVLMSEFVFSGDSADLTETIIDASSFAEEDTACVLFFPIGLTRATVVSGFTLRGGHGFRWPSGNRWGGCIFGEYANPQIVHNIIEQNNCHSYVAFYLEYSTGIVAYNIIRENQAFDGLGRCNYNITNGPSFDIEYNEIYGNFPRSDSPDPWLWDPGFTFYQSYVNVRMNDFHDYEGTQALGLQFLHSFGEISGNVFENISTAYWGYLIETTNFHTNIHDNVFRNCVTNDAAAIELTPVNRPAEPFHIWRNWFENITNEGGGPGCIWSQWPRALIEENVFLNCTGATAGAVQFTSNPPTGCEVELQYNSFFGNRSDWQGQPIGGSALADDNNTGLYASVHHNWFEGNLGNTVFTTSPENIWNLADNYWGNSTGPYHPTLNPEGLGDTLDNGASFAPWLTEPPEIQSVNNPVRLPQPERWELQSPYPNPFNATVHFQIHADRPLFFDVAIYNTLGRKIKSVWRGMVSRDETKYLTWQGNSDSGIQAAAGVYFIQAVAYGNVQDIKTAKAVLLR